MFMKIRKPLHPNGLRVLTKGEVQRLCNVIALHFSHEYCTCNVVQHQTA